MWNVVIQAELFQLLNQALRFDGIDAADGNPRVHHDVLTNGGIRNAGHVANASHAAELHRGPGEDGIAVDPLDHLPGNA